jgi:hypothetical protein
LEQKFSFRSKDRARAEFTGRCSNCWFVQALGCRGIQDHEKTAQPVQVVGRTRRESHSLKHGFVLLFSLIAAFPLSGKGAQATPEEVFWNWFKSNENRVFTFEKNRERAFDVQAQPKPNVLSSAE